MTPQEIDQILNNFYALIAPLKKKWDANPKVSIDHERLKAFEDCYVGVNQYINQYVGEMKTSIKVSHKIGDLHNLDHYILIECDRLHIGDIKQFVSTIKTANNICFIPTKKAKIQIFLYFSDVLKMC